MKRITSGFCIFLMLGVIGCSKKSVETPREESPTKFPVPTWQADVTGKYFATMTSVVALPATLAASATDNDKLAAFVNGECRGDGVIVKVDNVNLFFVLIQGLPDEANKISFKYYSNKTSYMYESTPSLTFLVDAVYGSAAKPKTLELTQLK